MSRRPIPAALSLTAAAALVFTGVSPSSAAVTTVSVVDFEDGTTGTWSQSGTPETLQVIDLEGGKVLEVAGRSADFVGIQSPAGIYEAGQTHTFTMRMRLAAGTPDTSARFVMKPSYAWIGNTTVTASAWTTVTGEFAVPADADVAALQAYIGTADIAGASAYTYYVDDIAVTTDDGGGEPVPDVPPGGLSTGFEDGLDGWGPRDSGSGAPAVAITTDPVHAGAQAAALTGRTSQGSGIGHDIATLQAGTTYEVTAWVRFGAGQPVGPVWLSLARTLEGSTTYSTLGQFSGVTNSGWTQVRASFPLTEFDSGLLYFETDYNGTNTSDLYFDDIAVTVPPPVDVQDLTPIKDTVEFPVGVAIDSRETSGAASELLLRHFDQVTSENYMKPEAWYDSARQFRADPEAITLMDYAVDNDLRVYGHTLVWHSQTPAWFFEDADGRALTDSDADQALLRERMREHIFAIAEWMSDEYGLFGSDTNPLVAFDVVNEVVSDASDTADGLRSSRWRQVLGEEFIDLAFAYADEAFNGEYAAPGAERPVTLFINDYNTEQSGKQARFRALVERLLERGVPVDGVGHQFHVSLAMPVTALSAAIDAFADLGLTQAVTELDVTTGTPVSEASLIEQGYYYRGAFRAFRERADQLFSVTVWGLTDGRSWRASSGAPLVFDDGLQAKPAYYGVVDDDLPARVRTGNAFRADVPLTADAPASAEWAKLPLFPVDESSAFQLRWQPDHLSVYATVDDATVQPEDAVEFAYGDALVRLPRLGGVGAVVVERPGGWDVVAHLPLTTPVAEGSTISLDVRVTDGASTASWNTPGSTGTITLLEPLSYVEVPRAASAPFIDGTMDDAWQEAASVSTDKQVQGSSGASAQVRTLWDDDTLYVLAHVVDPIVDVTGSDPWIQDSVEIYLDAGNVKNGSYRYDDMQLRISAANALSFGTGDEAFQRARVQSAVTAVADGYVVEAAISLLDAGGAGTYHGVDFQVNDAAAGVRTGIRNWADPSGAGYQSTARWGVARLVAAAVDPTEPGTGGPGVDPSPEQSPAPTGGAGTDPLAATGGSAPLGAVLLAIGLLVAGVVLRWRRRNATRG